ncbi:MAG: hypothetical protein NVS2B9_03550 [Myxococcales bacterium]
MESQERFMIERPARTSRLAIIAALIFQVAGCGTLLHPERKGQRGGEIDVGVAILDGIGLLFFIIPGAIAYAVDFSNGTIYLPRRARRASVEGDELRRVPFDPNRSNSADIEAILERETGRAIKLDGPGVQVFELKSIDEMKARFAANEGVRLASR